MASKEVELLVRKAWKSITDDPASWNQSMWIAGDNACGTTFCLGGWMMIHAGYGEGLNEWGDKCFFDSAGQRIEDPIHVVGPWTWDIHGHGKVADSIFDEQHGTLEDLKTAIEQAGIDLSEPLSDDSDFDTRCDNAIEDFVAEAAAAGDRMTVRHVRGDVILMSLLKKIRDIGIAEGWDKANSRNAGVQEAQHLLKRAQQENKVLEKRCQEAETDRGHALNEVEVIRKELALCHPQRVHAMEEVLKIRTRQASEAGQSARIARAEHRRLLADNEELTAQLASVRAGTDQLITQTRRQTATRIAQVLTQAVTPFLKEQ